MIDVVNTGLAYVLKNESAVLCSKSTKKEAARRALELSSEFGVTLSPTLKYWINFFNLK